MLTFRPHRIHYSTQGAGSESSNGDYTPASRVWGETYGCQAMNESKPNIVYHDGQQYKPSYKVLMSPDAPSLVFGDMVRLYKDETLIGEFQVLGFQHNQLSSYVWL